MAAGRACGGAIGLILDPPNFGHGAPHFFCDLEAVLENCVILVCPELVRRVEQLLLRDLEPRIAAIQLGF